MTLRLRWALAFAAGAVMAAVGTAVVLLVLSGRGAPEDLVLTVSLPALVVVGAVVLVRTNEVGIGLVLIGAGTAGLLSGPGSALRPSSVEDVAMLTAPERFLVVLAPAMFLVFLGLLLAVFPIIFPTGRAISVRWRTGLKVVGGLLLLQLVVALLTPEMCVDEQTREICVVNPIGVDGFPPAWVAFSLVVVMAIVGVSASIVRYRHSGDAERLQIKWVASSVTIIFGYLIIEAFVPALPGSAFALGTLTLLVPVSIGLAITKYRLYDIDRIISRTVTYAVVVSLLGALFGVAVVGLTPTLGGDAPPWLVAGSTLAVAALFTPLRRRVQRVVDRRFDRSRFDAQVVAEEFAEQVRDETDLEMVAAGLGEVSAVVFHPDSVGVWVRAGQS